MKQYVEKNALFEALLKISPCADDYDMENPDNKSLQDIAYWAARDMYNDISTALDLVEPSYVAPAVCDKTSIENIVDDIECAFDMWEDEYGSGEEVWEERHKSRDIAIELVRRFLQGRESEDKTND